MRIHAGQGRIAPSVFEFTEKIVKNIISLVSVAQTWHRVWGGGKQISQTKFPNDLFRKNFHLTNKSSPLSGLSSPKTPISQPEIPPKDRF